MKKQTLLIMLIGVLGLAGCGGAADAGDTEETASSAASSGVSEAADEEDAEDEATDAILSIPVITGDFSLEDCVSLGEYKGLDLTLEVEPVTEEYLASYLDYLVEAVETDDPDAAVQEGDIVNLDFEGKLDGEPFDGGTSQGYDLEIGSGSFIPGFEEGMIGMKVGETKDLELTFPESYVENLAGQDVVFTVTVNAIKQKPELDDAWVADYTDGDMKTAEEFREAKRRELEEENREYAESLLKNEAWQDILDGAEILAFPEAYLQESTEAFDDYIRSEAEMYDMETEAYLEEMGMTQEAYESYRDSVARDEAKNRLVQEAMLEAEGLTTDSPEYKEAMAELEELYAMTEQELRDAYGDETIEQYVFSDILMDKVLAYANIREVQAEE